MSWEIFESLDENLNKWLDESKMDEWSQEEWDLYLDKSEWNIDSELWIVSEKVIDTIEIDNSNLEEYNNFFDKVEQIQNEKNVIVEVNHKTKALLIHDKKNWSLIWEIHRSDYRDGWFFRENHLYNVVEDNYKWKWWWNIMFSLYELLWSENADFIVPEEEYTNIVSMINLYKKFGYEPKFKVLNWVDSPFELEDNDIEEFDEIIKNYKEWYKERKLWYTVILVREEN